MSLHFRQRKKLLPAVLALMLGVVGGCNDVRPTPVDAEKAREALQVALDGWKGTQTPDAVRSNSAIVVQDVDWEAGMRLVNYKIKGPGKELDANLRCPVELVLQDQYGTEKRKTVHYIIGTSPQVTVFREVLPP